MWKCNTNFSCQANVLVWQPRLLDNLDDRAKDLQKAIALHGKRHEEGSTSTKNDLAKLFHDPLRFRTGTGWLMVLFWWLFEINPVKRYELMDKKWTAVSWPPNYGHTSLHMVCSVRKSPESEDSSSLSLARADNDLRLSVLH